MFGFAVTDLATSLHRLLGVGQRVKWDCSRHEQRFFALVILVYWLAWQRADTLACGLTFEQELLMVVSTVLLFLTAAAACPDESHHEIIDLRAR